jgi:hypothetical protein
LPREHKEALGDGLRRVWRNTDDGRKAPESLPETIR